MLDGVVDAHVHLWPDRVLHSLWRWFDDHAWKIAFRQSAEHAIAHLEAHNVKRCVSLLYAHRAGIARNLNAFAAAVAANHPMVTPLGTVFPGEPNARQIVIEAVDHYKLKGIKLHCHVQQLAIDHPAVCEVLHACEELGVPAVVHCGREPASDAYGVDTHAICHASRCERVLQRFGRLRLIVPHVGADEFDAYFSLMDQHEHLYVDTSMACAEYFEHVPVWAQLEAHADRVLYGTDFPIVPYEYSRELRLLARRIVSDEAFDQIVRRNAEKIWPR
jgi:predicted TIM-barrel fold metal-dependent hydrolase